MTEGWELPDLDFGPWPADLVIGHGRGDEGLAGSRTVGALGTGSSE